MRTTMTTTPGNWFNKNEILTRVLVHRSKNPRFSSSWDQFHLFDNFLRSGIGGLFFKAM